MVLYIDFRPCPHQESLEALCWIIDNKKTLQHNYYNFSIENYTVEQVILKFVDDIFNKMPFQFIVSSDFTLLHSILRERAKKIDKALASMIDVVFEQNHCVSVSPEIINPNLHQNLLSIRKNFNQNSHGYANYSPQR